MLDLTRDTPITANGEDGGEQSAWQWFLANRQLIATGAYVVLVYTEILWMYAFDLINIERKTLGFILIALTLVCLASFLHGQPNWGRHEKIWGVIFFTILVFGLFNAWEKTRVEKTGEEYIPAHQKAYNWAVTSPPPPPAKTAVKDHIFLSRGEFKTFQLEPGECTPWIRSDYGVDQRFQRKYGEFRVCFRDTGKCYEPSKTPQHNTSDFKFCADTKADLRALIQ